jgi:hypothetical protein
VALHVVWIRSSMSPPPCFFFWDSHHPSIRLRYTAPHLTGALLFLRVYGRDFILSSSLGLMSSSVSDLLFIIIIIIIIIVLGVHCDSYKSSSNIS